MSKTEFDRKARAFLAELTELSEKHGLLLETGETRSLIVAEPSRTSAAGMYFLDSSWKYADAFWEGRIGYQGVSQCLES